MIELATALILPNEAEVIVRAVAWSVAVVAVCFVLTIALLLAVVVVKWWRAL